MKRRVVGLFLAVVLGSSLIGCGGSNGTPNSGTEAAASEEGNAEDDDVPRFEGEPQEVVVKSGVTNDKPVFQGASGSISRVSVHDPSIVKDMDTGEYYVFGSHLATAKSSDLVNWEQVLYDYQDVKNNPIYGNLDENLAESFEWAGSHDSDCRNGYAVWAPDVHWNDYYIWPEDGSRGAYMMYYSASSTWNRSCIGLAVSKNIEGPYTYVSTLVYSGFSSENGTDERSKIDKKWDNDYLNFNKLIKKGSANGGIDEVNEKWFKADGSYNTDYAPNAIDPTIIDGADGKLYMVYGSWSGGLYVLELDPETGLAKYPGTDSEDASGNFVDRYFGTHLAGSKHQSGEGGYILFDKETGYYYMYETYGGLTADGGYNMRLFRSESIYGPYLDAAGNNSADSGKIENTKYGIKLIGNYSFEGQRGYKSAGHNSALIDGDGQRYLIFHQRFNEGSEFHEVRVRQQFMNEDNWPCVAVYENKNEAIATYDKSEVVGTYEYINHGKENSKDMLKTESLTLSDDGKVSGAFEGTWEMTDSGKGYNYVTISMDTGLEFKGILFKQQNDMGDTVMTFSAIGTNNTTIWGSKAD